MSGDNSRRPWGFLVVMTSVVVAPAARADALSVVQMLRAGGCGGIVPAAPPLTRNPSLDRAAEHYRGRIALYRKELRVDDRHGRPR